MDHTNTRLRPYENENAAAKGKRTAPYTNRRRPCDRESFFKEEPDEYELSDHDDDVKKNVPPSELLESLRRRSEEVLKKYLPNEIVYKPEPSLPSKKNTTTRKIFPVQRLSKQLLQSSFKKKKEEEEKAYYEIERDVLLEYDPAYYKWTLPKEGYDRVDIQGCESGGYGAIIRDHGGRVRVAAAGISKPVILLYHRLEGLKKGLQLAKDCGCRKLYLCTTSVFVIRAVRERCIPSGKDDLPVVHNILVEIEKLLFEFKECYFEWIPDAVDKAAKYLCKVHKDDVFDRNGLPMELADIIWDDVSGKGYYAVQRSAEYFSLSN